MDIEYIAALVAIMGGIVALLNMCEKKENGNNERH